MIKVDVWGNGRLGRDIVDIIGEKKIGVIVDSDSSKIGKKYENISILSPKQYFEMKDDNPIIVTPKDSEEKIVNELNRNGKRKVYRFSNESGSLIYFNFQINGYKLLEENHSKKSNLVVGDNLLALFVSDYFDDNNIKYKKEKTDENMGAYEQIFYCVPTLNRKGIHLANYPYFEKITYKTKLEKYKNIHTGQRCFIVATGPSLTVEDLDCLHRNKEWCFSVNTIYKSYMNTEWRPNYYLVGDSEICRNNIGYLSRKDEVEKFVSDFACNPKFYDDISASVFHAIRDDEHFEFISDFAKGSYVGGSIVIDGCIPLAVYMGFKEIYMIGNDCSYVKGGTTNHFGIKEKPDMINHGVDRMLYFYEKIKMWMDDSDVTIYNATRGGKLEIFDRVDFDSLF